MAMEIFKLLGTVAISKDKALKDIKAIQDQAKRASTEMGRSFGKFTGYVEKHSAQIKKAGKYMTVFGGIATAAFALSVKSAANFETQLANVSTMLDESAMKILPEYRKGLQSLSIAFGESTETLSKGLYDILSASIPPAEALGVLEVSAKAAAAGITDTGVAADAITTILNSYGMSADQAGMVSDKLFAIVKGGKTTFAELAPSIGKVAATASMAGLSFDDLGACIATMTRAGIRTEETMTAINGVLIAFLKPTDDAIEAAAKFGLELNTNTLRTEGLTGVMDKLKNATAEQLASIFPNIRGLKGMAAALGDAEGYARDYALMLDSAGLTQEAFAKQSDTLNFKLNQLKEMFNVIKVTVGTALIPAVEDIVKRVMKVLKGIKEWTEANPKLTKTIVKWAAGISVLMLGLGPLLMILPGLLSSIGLIKGGVLLLSKAVMGLYKVLGPFNVLVLLIAANILIWKKNIELLTEAIRANKNIAIAEDAMIKSKGKALLKLQKAYKMTGEELAYWIREGKLAPSVLERIKKKTEEGTEATDENTEATEENTEATEENVDSKIKWLTVSGLVEAEIANLTAQYELSNKTTAETAQYYSNMITRHEELIEKLKEERQSHQEGTVDYQTYTSAIYAAELKIKDLVTATEELHKVESDVLVGLELVTAQLRVLGNKYSDVTKDEEYFTEKANLLKQEYEELNAELKETEFHSTEWFELTNQLLDNEEATRKLKEEWEEFNEVQSDALTGIELVNAELILLGARYKDVAKDEDYVIQKTALLNEKYRLLNQALAETEFHSAEWFELTQNIIAVETELGNLDGAIDTSAQRWADFFTELKDKYSDSIGAIQSGISSFVSTFQGAIETALTSLWHMAETNAEIQQQMAETEQEYIDAKLEMNEDYKQALINKLSEYVDAKELANLSIAELETLLKEHSIASYTEMSEANQIKLDELAAKYDEILGEMEGEQVTFESIMKDLWKTLVDAIITELIRLAAFYIVKWLFGLFLGEGGGVGYDLGGLVKGYDIGGRVKALEANQKKAEYFAMGGPKGTDVVPAWLTPGEYVVDKPMTDFIRRTGAVTANLIRAIQMGTPTPAPAFAGGGLVGAVGGGTSKVELNIMPGAIMINTKYLDDRAIAQAGPKLFAEIEKQARGAGKVLGK
ncbi:hypothetical protein ES703_08471 [subsurface metagenome]